MERVLKWLAVAMGVACAGIGLYHVVLGIGSVPGEGTADTIAGVTVDSRERFYNAIFFGYGVAWLWVARQSPIPRSIVRWLAAFMFLGGIGRLLSLAVYGAPHWFQIPLTVIELVLPPLIVALTVKGRR
ncbi:DUF4345 domain-containing protein [Actinoplanes sp. CA-142083]|uniref:DUF4345 domain-containing protein n=1 Tax=Actinoplanes sp. CA-142083 TaxID=3239903 RepID=UPI003D8B12BF